MEPPMATTLTTKGQVTIPKKVRDALCLSPGDSVEFMLNPAGEVVLHRVAPRPAKTRTNQTPDRFEAMRGKAQVKWRTDDLMALLRDND